MALSPKSSDGQIVVIAVDAQSLSQIGAWPWSRAVHATLLDTIKAGAAIDVFFDFDFTFPADAAGDQAFIDALIRAGGATYLAVFEQALGILSDGAHHVNLPMSEFADQSWPVLANVHADENGIVRAYPYGAILNGEFVPSAAALLANALTQAGSAFEIDFSIDPGTIPTFSAIDVLNGDIPASAFAGKSVIVGASALELADLLATPVHGIVPGPLIHALAAETLMRNLNPLWMRPGWVVACLAMVLVLLQILVQRFSMSGFSFALFGLAGIELAALHMFRAGSILVPTALLYPGVAVFCVWLILHRIQASDWLLFKTSTEANNTLSLLKRVFDDSSDGIVIIRSDGTILRHSRSAKEILGTGANGHIVLPKKFARLVNSRFNSQSHSSHPQHLEVGTEGQRRLIEFRATKSDIELPTAMGKDTRQEQVTAIVFRDITLMKEQEQDIAYLSNYDDRTGALRRGAFLTFLEMRLENTSDVAVFALTLDRFKTINVTLGRAIGDALLKEIVARLEKTDFQLSAPVRLDGTSFAFYTEGIMGPTDPADIAQAILNDIARPYRLEDANAQIAGRIGYTLIKGDSEISAATALDRAEEAMDATKTAGVSVAPYDHSAWETQQRARQIERALEDALACDEFRLLYQSQHRVSDGQLIGAEALIRWQSPKLGAVFPDEFIGIAESTGFIVELGKWTLRQAATDAKTLPQELAIAVNVSGVQLMNDGFERDVAVILSQVGLPAHRICLELTETVLLAATRNVIETMQDLSFSGITWALDDFGTGFSSMEYLSKMPLDKVKLDKSFIMNLGTDPTARPILHSTSELCHGLGVKLLCEGVETKEHLAILMEENCAEAQGYYFGKPMPIEMLRRKAKVA